MRGKNRNSIEEREKLPQFTTMHVIDGQADIVNYASLIFYSLTINNILNIIVMIILVAVTVNIVIQGGLFETATSAKEQTEVEMNKELLFAEAIGAMGADGMVSFETLNARVTSLGFTVIADGMYGKDGYIYRVNGATGEVTVGKEGAGYEGAGYEGAITGLGEGTTVVGYEELEGLNNPESQNEYLQNLGTNLKAAVNEGKVSSVIKETINGVETIAVIPAGFTVSTEDGEDSISEGLVLRDGENEFVWMPYTDTALYVEDSFGPLTGTHTVSGTRYTYDTQEDLDYYYGTGFYNYSQDFTYAQDKEDIEESINKYRGFIVGRYETTITSSGTIGSMPNEDVLQASGSIAQTNNKQVRWYGLYKVQKDLYAEDDAVFSSMITSKEWDRIMTWTGYGSTVRDKDTTYTTKPDKSGSSYANDSTQYDETHNIYDLAGNVWEWTLKAYSSSGRTGRGGTYGISSSASVTSGNYPNNGGYSDR